MSNSTLEAGAKNIAAANAAGIVGGPWGLYDQMIAGVPEDIQVKDFSLGLNWSFVDSEVGAGVAYTARGGGKTALRKDLRGASLKEVAALSKSWCFEDATLGIAALNAWYNNPDRIRSNRLQAEFEEPATVGYGEHREIKGQKLDSFDLYHPTIQAQQDAQVVVVGHFPHVDKVAEYARLTVLERNCRDEWDTPDPACEYVIPEADFAFITGVTLINKTAPRLLELAKAARVIMVGPSVVMCPMLLDRGVETLSGSIVTDPEALAWHVKAGTGRLFGSALSMCTVFTAKTPR